MSPPQVTTAAGTHYEICDSLQILIEEHALCGKCLDVQFASAAGEDADGTFFDAGPSANEHGERGSLRAVGIPFQFVVVRPDGNIEGLVLDYRPPEFSTRLAALRKSLLFSSALRKSAWSWRSWVKSLSPA